MLFSMNIWLYHQNIDCKTPVLTNLDVGVDFEIHYFINILFKTIDFIYDSHAI